jgi:hypothetical protein
VPVLFPLYGRHAFYKRKIKFIAQQFPRICIGKLFLGMAKLSWVGPNPPDYNCSSITYFMLRFSTATFVGTISLQLCCGASNIKHQEVFLPE